MAVGMYNVCFIWCVFDLLCILVNVLLFFFFFFPIILRSFYNSNTVSHTLSHIYNIYVLLYFNFQALASGNEWNKKKKYTNYCCGKRLKCKRLWPKGECVERMTRERERERKTERQRNTQTETKIIKKKRSTHSIPDWVYDFGSLCVSLCATFFFLSLLLSLLLLLFPCFVSLC